MRVILHVGLHKTGSSSLQVALSEAERLPFAYPRSGREIVWRGGHHDLVALDEPGPLIDALVAEIESDPRDVALVSCEDLSRPDHEWRLSALTAALGAHEVELVAVLRRHDHFFESYYAEEVKRGRTSLRAADFLAANASILRYRQTQRRLEAATGRTCRLVPYRDDFAPADCAEALTGRRPDLPEVGRRNARLPPLATLALREVLARGGPALGPEDVARLYATFAAMPPEVKAAIGRLDGLLEDEVVAEIEAMTAEENRALGRQFFGCDAPWWHGGRGVARRVPACAGERLVEALLLAR